MRKRQHWLLRWIIAPVTIEHCKAFYPWSSTWVVSGEVFLLSLCHLFKKILISFCDLSHKSLAVLLTKEDSKINKLSHVDKNMLVIFFEDTWMSDRFAYQFFLLLVTSFHKQIAYYPLVHQSGQLCSCVVLQAFWGAIGELITPENTLARCHGQ